MGNWSYFTPIQMELLVTFLPIYKAICITGVIELGPFHP